MLLQAPQHRERHWLILVRTGVWEGWGECGTEAFQEGGKDVPGGWWLRIKKWGWNPAVVLDPSSISWVMQAALFQHKLGLHCESINQSTSHVVHRSILSSPSSFVHDLNLSNLFPSTLTIFSLHQVLFYPCGILACVVHSLQSKALVLT